jgi:hypothetical protein
MLEVMLSRDASGSTPSVKIIRRLFSSAPLMISTRHVPVHSKAQSWKSPYQYGKTYACNDTSSGPTPPLTKIGFSQVMMHQVAPVRPIVIFFNKKDRFQEKIKHVSARKYIKTYQGQDGDYKAIVRHIADLFKQRIKKSSIQRGGVYMKTTNMTDSQNMHYIFKSFYDFMIRRSLEESGVSQKKRSSSKGGESRKRTSSTTSSPSASPSTPKRSKRSNVSAESANTLSTTSWRSETVSDDS